MAMHGRMPVKATVESRMHCFRGAHIILIVVYVIEFVREFLLDALHGERSEVRGLGLIQGELSGLGDLSPGDAETRERDNQEEN